MPDAPDRRAPPGKVNAVIIDGMLVPDADSVRSMLWTLHQRIRKDAALAERYKSNPGEVLGQIGLCQALQKEVMRAEGFEIPEAVGCLAPPDTCLITVLPV